MTLRTLPLALARRHAPPFLKHRLRDVRTWAREFRKRQRISGPVFVCGGRMEFWPEHGQELHAREPAFRSAVHECDHLLRQAGEEPVLAYFEGTPGSPYVTEENRQAHLSLVMQIAMLELWRARGVQPEALLGLGLGEVAAVYAAGGLTLADALAVGTSWSRIDRLEAPEWGMLEVAVEPARVGELTNGSPAELSLVAVTGERQCTFLCPLGAMPMAREYLQRAQLSWRDIDTRPQRPYHSIILARHEEQLRQPLEALRAEPLARPCYLGSLGRSAPPGTVLGPDYWLTVLQHPVLVHHALEAARRDGYRLMVPTGCEPQLLAGHPIAQWALAKGLPPLAPARDVPASETFAAAGRALAARGLIHAGPATRPKLTLPEFLAEFAPQTCRFIGHPAATFEYLRRAGGIHYLPREEGWLVLETKLINAVLGEPEAFGSSVNVSINPEIIGADPPAHTAMRALFQPFFALKELRSLDAYVDAAIAELAAPLAGRASFDFVAEFVLPLTQSVSSRLIGLNARDAGRLHHRLPGPVYSFGYHGELRRFLEEFFATHEPSGQSPMLDMMADHVRTGLLTPESAVNLAKFMWEAGAVTSSMLISSAVRFLLVHPEVAGQLRSDPDLIGAFVEEMLRLENPLNTFLRVTTRPVTLGNKDLPAGTLVICCITAANRDPARYTRPDEVDLHRGPVRHLTFAGGIHACIGAPIARLETRKVVQWVLAAGPALRLAEAFAVPAFFPVPNMRALATLPLQLRSGVPA